MSVETQPPRADGSRVARILARVAIPVLGLFLGLVVGGSLTTDVGPLVVNLSLAYTGGQSTVTVPPLGSVTFHPYYGPVGLDVTVLDIDKNAAAPLLSGQESLAQVQEQTISQFEDAAVLLIAKSILFSLLGVVLMSSLLWRRPREALVSVGVSVLLVLAGLGVSVATYDSAKVREPTFSGTLAQGSGVVGDVKDIEQKYTDYRRALVKIVTNVSRIYSIVTDLPAQPTDEDSIRVLHISDIHLNPAGLDLTADLVKQFKIDFVVDTGDINDWGTKFEDFIVQRIKSLEVPYVYVRGNHDSPTTAAEVAKQPNALVLEDRIVNIDGLTIAGIGDPRFTPDKADGDDHATVTKVQSVGKTLLKKIEKSGAKVDFAMFHDPRSGKALEGRIPLILAGHTHARDVEVVKKSTLLLVEGSTGGAGLRGTEAKNITPLEASVLYFSRTTHKLIAWDAITEGGLGKAEVTIERHTNPLG